MPLLRRAKSRIGLAHAWTPLPNLTRRSYRLALRNRSSVIAATLPAKLPFQIYLALVLQCQIKFPGAQETYWVPELMEQVAAYCDHPTLMVLSRANGYGREIAQREMGVRIKTMLHPFIKPDEYDRFMNALHTVGGGVMGSVARQILACNAPFMNRAIAGETTRFYQAENLNIVVPFGKLTPFTKALEEFGYDGIPQFKNIFPAFDETVASVCDMEREDEVAGQTLKLTLTESLGGIMQVMLAAPISAQSNLITPTRIYSQFPNLVTMATALRTDNLRARFTRRTVVCYDMETSNRNWTYPCGALCPAKYRKSVGDKGVASFVWNSTRIVPRTRFQDTDYLLAESILAWRYSIRCRNLNCDNYCPAAR
ncbi:hypothetical protein MD484_g572, partial [Candolleomyces efflorescens]